MVIETLGILPSTSLLYLSHRIPIPIEFDLPTDASCPKQSAVTARQKVRHGEKVVAERE